MTSTVFKNFTSPAIPADWLNDLNRLNYTVFGNPTDAQAAAANLSVDQTVANYTALQAIPVVTGQLAVRVLGRTTAGDGGTGFFTWQSGDQSANVTADPQQGVWVPPTSDATGASGAWKRQIVGDRVYAKWFGAKFDGATDDTTALRAFAKYVTQNNSHGIFPSGIALVSDYIQFGGEPYVTGFSTFVLSGPGGSMDIGCVIESSAIDKPIIVVQSARGARLYDFAVKGPNTAPSGYSATNIDPDVANWISTGLSASQWSPQCGIAVDPFTYSSTAAPSGGYTGATYQLAASMGVRVTNVSAMSNVIGFLYGVYGANGDSVTFDQCESYRNAYAFASGDSQARGVTLQNCNWLENHTGVDTRTFGNQNGAAPSIFGGECAVVARFFNTIAIDSGTAIASGWYAESVLSLGVCGTGALFNIIPVIRDCYISFATGTPPSLVALFSPRRVCFDGCTFSITNNPHHALNVITNDGSAGVSFKDCNIRADALDTAWGAWLPFGLSQDVCKTRAENLAVYGNGGLDNHFSYDSTYVCWAKTGARLELAPWTRFVDDRSNGMFSYKPGSLINHAFASGRYLAGGACSAFSWNTSAGTMSFTATTPEDFQVGDVLMWKTIKFIGYYAIYVPALVITSISGTTINCDMLAEPSQYDTTDTPSTIRQLVREWSSGTVSITGDLTSGSTTIANVTNASTLKVGDVLLPSAGGLPVNTRVTAISGTNVTISRSATASHTGTTLNFGQITAM